MGIERRFNKLTRKFQRRLSGEEINFRVDSTRKVVYELRQDQEWKDWITGAIIFGSTARLEARTGSDVDLAILTKQSSFFGLDFQFVTHQIRNKIIMIQNDLRLGRFHINPQIIAEIWLNNPQLISEFSEPSVIENIKKEGRTLF